jgi:hypothetical protein
VIAAAGLAVATAPDFAHYLPLFQSLANKNDLTTGLATVLAPSVAATLFILLAILALHRKSGRTQIPGNWLRYLDSVGSPCGHDLHILWATHCHQGDVLYDRCHFGHRLGRSGRASVRIWGTQRRDPQERVCGGRLHIYRHITARHRHQRCGHIASAAHASASATATHPECGKGSKDTTPALPRYGCHISLVVCGS